MQRTLTTQNTNNPAYKPLTALPVPLPGASPSHPCSHLALSNPPHSSTLSSEALEEFLSILRPAIFPPSSPLLRPRRNGTLTFGVAYKPKPKIDASLTKSDQSNSSLAEESDPLRQSPTYSPEPISDHLPGNWDIFGPEITARWHAQVLGAHSYLKVAIMTTHRPIFVQHHPSPACKLATLSPVMLPMISPFLPSDLPPQ